MNQQSMQLQGHDVTSNLGGQYCTQQVEGQCEGAPVYAQERSWIDLDFLQLVSKQLFVNERNSPDL